MIETHFNPNEENKMKSVYVITCQSSEVNTTGVFTNLKELHKALVTIQGDLAPSYSQLTKDFKERKEYITLSICYHNDDEYKCCDVTYTEVNTL